MDTKLIIGIIILIICCILAFLIPLAPPGKNSCFKNNYEYNVVERKVNSMEWYWITAIVAALAGLFYWFFVR